MNEHEEPTRAKTSQVAQQVIGLFKDALTLEEDATASSSSTDMKDKPTENGTVYNEEANISIKDKVASFNSGRSPVKDAEITKNNTLAAEEAETTKSDVRTVQSEPLNKVHTNQEPVTNGDAKKAAVKQEKVDAGSYDESLDQFYDVLEELTTS